MSQSKVTAFFAARKGKTSQNLKNASTIDRDIAAKSKRVVKKSAKNICRTPKRNVSTSDELKLDSKKRRVANLDEAQNGPQASSSPSKTQHKSARKRLDFVQGRTESLGSHSLPENMQGAKLLEMKVKLRNPVQLKELKEKLARFDDSCRKSSSFQANKFKITSGITSGSSKCITEKAEKGSAVPAYAKYSSLAVPDQPPGHLILPFKYRTLSETFRCSDTVVSMLNNRKERCTFEKLRNGIQDMSKKTFTETHLGQIQSVFSKAYHLHIEKHSGVQSRPGSQYQLVVEPNLENCEQVQIGESSANAKKQIKCLPKVGQNNFVLMTPSVLVGRRAIFNNSLLDITKKHHQEFLCSLKPPVLVPVEKLTHWHPKFAVDSVPDIVACDLPQPPDKLCIVTAKDALEKMKGTTHIAIEKALQLVAEKNSSVEEVPQPSMQNKKGIKGISLDLLNRIRARESKKIMCEMTKDPNEKKRVEMLERVPELVRILRIYFITEKRAAISIEEATKKIMDSYHTFLSPVDVKEHLQLMAEIFPKWLSIIAVRKGFFLKIDKNQDINVLLAKMPITSMTKS